MADISNLITKIRNAIYGRDVRSAIADALNILNSQAVNSLQVTGGSMVGPLGTITVNVGAFGSLVSHPIIFKTHPSAPIENTAVSIWGENILTGSVYEPVLKVSRVNGEGLGTELARTQCAEPIDDDDAVTKKYFLQNMDEIVDSKIESALDDIARELPLTITFTEQTGNSFICDALYHVVASYANAGRVIIANVVMADGSRWSCNLLSYSPGEGLLMFSNSAHFDSVPEEGIFGVAVTYDENGNITVSIDEAAGR